MAKRKANVMVAYSGEATDVLRDALRDNLSPEAVAGIAACIVGANEITKVAPRKEVLWFRDLLAGMVEPEYSDIIEELGL